MVLAFAATDVLKMIAPPVALHELTRRRCEQQPAQARIVKLLTQQLFHDREFEFFPLRAQWQVLADALGFACRLRRANLRAQRAVERLGCLIRVFDGLILHLVEHDDSGPEVRQEAILAVEILNRRKAGTHCLPPNEPRPSAPWLRRSP